MVIHGGILAIKMIFNPPFSPYLTQVTFGFNQNFGQNCAWGVHQGAAWLGWVGGWAGKTHCMKKTPIKKSPGL